jgi:uncharacterized membrane protein required for colicin V production
MRGSRAGARTGGCVDVVAFIQGLNLFDILAAFFVAGFFVVGYVQGTLRRLLGLAICLVSLLLAMNLRDPLGAWLAGYWSDLPKAYVYMIAFGLSFLVIYILGSITVQTFYKRANLFGRATVLDELVGGILGAIQALLLIGILILVLDSYYHLPSAVPGPRELDLLHRIYEFYNGSQIVDLYRSSLIPLFFALFGWIAPSDLREMYP